MTRMATAGVLSLTLLLLHLATACGDPPAPVVPVPSQASSAPTPSASATGTAAAKASESPSPPMPVTPPADASTSQAKPTCDTPCRGTMPGGLDVALHKRVVAAHRCYDSALVQDPSLQGKIVMDVLIAKDGGACAANVVSSAKGMDGVAGCVGGLLQSETYPAPGDGCVSVKIPITFVPKTK